jgi:hypothetical protein
VKTVSPTASLSRRRDSTTSPAAKKLHQRQIEATDAEIDALVYEL